MSCVRCVRGIASGIEYSADAPMNLDPADGRPVEMVLDLERLARDKPGMQWYDPTRRDMWRFGALMALDAADPGDARHIVALGEGCTPLLDYRAHPLARAAGLDLRLKEEGCAHAGYGANPTQSFKDRGMAMVVAQARRLGLTKLAVPTQGTPAIRWCATRWPAACRSWSRCLKTCRCRSLAASPRRRIAIPIA